jgi:hypothetical protein
LSSVSVPMSFKFLCNLHDAWAHASMLLLELRAIRATTSLLFTASAVLFFMICSSFLSFGVNVAVWQACLGPDQPPFGVYAHRRCGNEEEGRDSSLLSWSKHSDEWHIPLLCHSSPFPPKSCRPHHCWVRVACFHASLFYRFYLYCLIYIFTIWSTTLLATIAARFSVLCRSIAFTVIMCHIEALFTICIRPMPNALVVSFL